MNTRWTVSASNGFLPSPGVWSSPLAQSGHWIDDLIELASRQHGLTAGDFLASISSSPTPNLRLTDFDDSVLEQAYAALAFLVAKFLTVRGDKEEVPASLSRPFLQIAEHYGRKPTLTYGSYVLANWRGPSIDARVDPDQVDVALTFSGTETERRFVAVHVAIESLGAEAVQKVLALRQSLAVENDRGVVTALGALTELLNVATGLLPMILDRFDPSTFRTEVRPFLFGFQGVRFGHDNSTEYNFVGESGAQSGLLRYLDAITTPVSRSTPMVGSIDEFISYAPTEHQRAIADASEVGQGVQARGDISKDVDEALQDVRAAHRSFRRAHLTVVRSALHPGDGPLGTGGTIYETWLSELIDEVG